MNIKSLQDLNLLPIAEKDTEIGERIKSILCLAVENTCTITEIADAIVDVIFNAAYMVFIPKDIESDILKWISRTYDQNNLEYIDALSTIFANMSTIESTNTLKRYILNAQNIEAKNLLDEVIKERENAT